MTLAIELYGRLREAGLGPVAEVAAGPSPRAGEALAALSRALGPRAGWLDGAVLATERAVLRPEDPIPPGARLAALPPVCGG
jgi:molybdopterin converting factor small subunit